MHVYALAADAPKVEVKVFHDKLQNATSQTSPKYIIYIIGDFNSKVGSIPEKR